MSSTREASLSTDILITIFDYLVDITNCNIYDDEIRTRTISLQLLNSQFNHYYDEHYWWIVLKTHLMMSCCSSSDNATISNIKQKIENHSNFQSFRRCTLLFLMMRRKGLGLTRKKTEYRDLCKILVLGKAGVGKTNCILNYVYSNNFPYDHEIAIEDSYRKISDCIENIPIVLDLFELVDINEIDDFRMRYINESNIVIIICDLHSEQSVKYLESDLLPIIGDKISKLPILIAINDKKKKENNSKNQIKKESIKSTLERHSISHYSIIEISTSNYPSIENLFANCTTMFAYSLQKNIELIEIILKKDTKLLSKNCLIH